MEIKFEEMTINGLTKEQVIALSTDEQLALLEAEILALDEENPNKIIILKSLIRLMKQEKMLTEIEQIKNEAREIRKSLIRKELDKIKDGLFDDFLAKFDEEEAIRIAEAISQLW